jgi:small subunit ribosomal protein S13
LARISGVDLEKNKRIDIALTRIYGIGRSSSVKILDVASVDHAVRVVDLTESQVTSIRKVIDVDYRVEGELRKELSMDIKRLMDMGCYRGLRHRKNLPVRGQRTSTNARTRKGPKKGAVSRKK